MKKLLVLLFLMIIFCSNVFAVSPQKKVFDGLSVETGTSTKNIMTLLTNIAGEQQVYFKRKGYFKRIYGQYRYGYIIITVYSSGKIRDDLEELETIGKQISHNVMTEYPSAEGKVRIAGDDSEPWQSFTIEFKNGRAVSKRFFPNKEEINRIIKLRKKESVDKFELSESERNKIFKEIVRAGDIAYDKSKKLYPYGRFTAKDPEFYEIVKKRGKSEDEIYEKELKKLSDKYNLSRKQLEEILQEGDRKRWPMPEW